MKFLKVTLVSAFLMGAAFSSKAQLDFSTFLEGGVDDANTILENYLEPAFIGFGYGINSGWYNTAKPHKLLGFDVTTTVNFAMVPTKSEFFTINPDDYNNISLNSSSPTNQAPTLFGPNLPAEELPLLDYANEGNDISISSPTGLGLDEAIAFNAVPSAMFQVGIGIVKNTDIKVRFIPEISGDDYSFQMLGIGIMHDLKQWVPGFKQMPIDISGFVGWNRIESTLFLNSDQTQSAVFTTNGFTLQGLVSKKFAILTLFGGVGIATTGSSFELLGDYETEAGPIGSGEINLDYSSTGPRINAGFRLKLLILTLHADYAIQRFNTLTVGVGLSIR